MFGEDDSESPRAGSPWDALPSTSPPKLVPEVEQGNIEYKLKLISPTPERFARLVTQLKWRLLEGGGQALYELGVADSGELIGLEREAMEASLMTLEEMAGEIGASVIVVKEIAVPIPTRKMISAQKTNEAFLVETDGEETTTDTDLSTPEPDTDELGMSTLSLTSPSFHMRANPARPTAQSSPALFPLDADPLCIAPNDIPNDHMTLEPEPPAIDLAIASVFKPRPTRRRAPHTHSHGHGHHAGPGTKKRDALAYANIKTKVTQHTSTKVTGPQAVPITIVPPTPTTTSPTAPKLDGVEHVRRGTRDRRRQEKKLRGHVAGDTVFATKTMSASTTTNVTTTTTAAMVLKLDDDIEQVVKPDVESVAVISTTTTSLTANTIRPPDSPSTSDSDSDINICATNKNNTPHTPHTTTPRLIVEVLVVRKLSVEEAFLDFGGFALEL